MLFFKYLSMHLKKEMQYKVSFLFLFISQVISIFIELFVALSLFDKFKLFDMYSVNEMLMIFGIVWFGMSFSEAFGRGFDHFGNLIKRGEFDLLLVRPRGLFIQIIGSEIAYEKLARVICSIDVITYATIHVPNLNIFIILLIILLMFLSSLLFLSLFIMGATLCFFTTEGLEVVNIVTDGTRQLGQYPMSIYKQVVVDVFTFIIPLTAVNYYPIKFIFYDRCINNLLFIFIIPIFYFISSFIFKFGVSYYASTGS